MISMTRKLLIIVSRGRKLDEIDNMGENNVVLSELCIVLLTQTYKEKENITVF